MINVIHMWLVSDNKNVMLIVFVFQYDKSYSPCLGKLSYVAQCTYYKTCFIILSCTCFIKLKDYYSQTLLSKFSAFRPLSRGWIYFLKKLSTQFIFMKVCLFFFLIHSLDKGVSAENLRESISVFASHQIRHKGVCPVGFVFICPSLKNRKEKWVHAFEWNEYL